MAKRYSSSAARRASQKRYRARRKSYNNYLSLFESRVEVFERRGLEFYDPIPLSYRDWKSQYAEKRNVKKM